MTRRGTLALALLIAGCGFQLRAWDLAETFATARIDGDASVDLHRDLARALTAAGVRVVDEGADVVVALTEQRSERREVSITGAGRAAEVELALAVEFAVRAADGTELVALRPLRSERLARMDTGNLIGSSEQQAVVNAQLRADLVGYLMRALGALARASAREIAHAGQD